MSILRSCLIAISALLMAACSEPLDTGIIGSWHGKSPPQSLHFRSSGTVLLDDRKLDRQYRGHYTIDGSRLEMHFDTFRRPVVREAGIRGDTLTLLRDAGPPEVLRR